LEKSKPKTRRRRKPRRRKRRRGKLQTLQAVVSAILGWLKSALKYAALWLREFSRRIGLVIANPFKAFREIAENPDIGGPIAILVILIAMDLINRQLFMLFKTDLYILKKPDLLEPLNPSLMDYTTAIRLAVMSLVNYGYFILRNTAIYYLMAWLFKAERRFTTILMATIYSISVYIIGKIIEAAMILFVVPPLTVVVAVDTAVVMLSSSITLVLMNMKNIEIADAMTNTYKAEWEKRTIPQVLFNIGYSFSIWSYLICSVALYILCRMQKKKALVAGLAPAAVDAIIKLVLYGGFF